MPRFSANLTMLFTEVDLGDRFERAAGAGFTAVEYMFPYAYEADQLADKLQRYGLMQVLFNLPAGRWEAGERGIALLPDRRGEFQEGVGLAVEYAKILKCSQVNCLVGLTPNLPENRVRETDVLKVREALWGGFAQSRILDVHGERMIQGTFQPGFRIRLHPKDLRLALQTGKEIGVSLPNAATAQELFTAVSASGGAELDHAAMVQALERLANLRIGEKQEG